MFSLVFVIICVYLSSGAVTGQCSIDSCLVIHTNRLQAVENQINELRAENEQLRNDVTELQQKCSPVVAFSARMEGGTHRPTTFDPLPFSDVVSNEGGAYDSSSYTFTCPVKGVYFFGLSMYSGWLIYDSTTYSVRSTAGIHHSRLGLVVGFHNQNKDPDHFMDVQAATSTVIVCSEGETVWVSPRYASNNQFVSKVPDYPRCSFTGFLINTL